MDLDVGKIEVLLAEQKLSKSALAVKSGVSRQSIGTILRKESCSPITAGKLAKGLGVLVSDIIRMK